MRAIARLYSGAAFESAVYQEEKELIRRLKWGVLLLAALGISAQSLAAEFTQADLEKMVKELDTVLPRDPKLDYPIKCTLETNKKINAYAWCEKQTGTERKRAIMVVFTGLVDYYKGNKDIIRACVAHEVSHLSRGHCSGYAFLAKDLNNLYTRQNEFEADVSGVSALQRLGYSKKAMVDLLMGFEKMDRHNQTWWDALTADHADSKARIAEFSDDKTVMQSLVTFDVALAFCDSRRWNTAGKFFDEAAAKEPKLTEAYVNSAQCSLNYYYDLLPFSVREGLLRVDFGPLLQDPAILIRAATIDESDRRRYKAAQTKIEQAMTKVPGNDRLKEMLAVCQVLEPDGDKPTIQKGVDGLKALLAASKDEYSKMRYANNACVGLHRLGDLDAGYKIIMDTSRGTTAFNYCLGENLGRILVKVRNKDDENLAAEFTGTWLERASSIAPYYDQVLKAYNDSMTKLGLTAKKIEPKPMQFCRAASLWHKGSELSLFRPVAEFETLLGKPEKTILFDEKYPDLTEMRWPGGNFAVLTERGQAMRVTTYEPGSYIFMQPTERSESGGFPLKVGMTVDDLKKIVDPSSGVAKQLVRAGKLEDWKYFEGMGIGILITDDKVAGITVTPVEYEQQ